MTAPDFTEADFLASLQALLPPGRAWPRDPDTVLTKVLDGWARAYAQVYARQAHLLVDAFPATTEEMLPEWEATLGLPDPCAGPDALTSERQAHVVARFAYTGGQTVPYFIAFAAQLGYPITITEFAPFRVGHPCGTPCYGIAWAHAWQINGAPFEIHYFLAGIDTAGNPLASWGSTVLQCEITRIAPAQSVVIFA